MEIALGLFLGRWIPAKISKAAANSGVCLVKNGVYYFRIHRSVGYIGIALLLIAACAVFMPHWIIQIMWLAVFMPIGLPVLLFWLVPKISIDEEKITYRNRIGVKTQILWRDVMHAYATTTHGSFMVLSQNRHLLVSSYICCYPQIRHFVEHYCPEAFSSQAALSFSCKSEIKSTDGTQYFSQQRYLLRAPVLLLVLTLFIFIQMLITTPESFRQDDIFIFLFVMLMPTILLSLLFTVPRVRLDDNSICYRNAVGISRCIEWRDVRTVETVDVANIQSVKVSDGRKSITVSRAYCSYDVIRELIMGRIPTAAKRIQRRGQR